MSTTRNAPIIIRTTTERPNITLIKIPLAHPQRVRISLAIKLGQKQIRIHLLTHLTRRAAVQIAHELLMLAHLHWRRQWRRRSRATHSCRGRVAKQRRSLTILRITRIGRAHAKVRHLLLLQMNGQRQWWRRRH